MKGQTFLKVTSILMIIGGIIAAIAGVLAVLGLSALAALADSAEGMGLLYFSSVLVVVASVVELIAGIKGLGACKMPQKAAGCVKWGVIIAVLSVLSIIISLAAGGEFKVINLILNLLLPGLYVYGAVQMKNAVQ